MVEETLTSEAPALRSAPFGRWRMLAVCCMAGVAAWIEPPLWILRPPGVQAFGQNWVDYNLIVSIITLITLTFLLAGGTLGDIFGRRRVILVGLGGLVVANLLLLMSRSIPWFLAMRFVVEISGALVVPLSLTFLYLIFAEDVQARYRAIAVYIVVTSIASLSSGLLGQLLATAFDWRAAFAIPTALAAVAFALFWRYAPEGRAAPQHRLDAIGHAAWTLMLLALVFGVLEYAPSGAYGNIVLLASLSFAAIGLVLLIWWERYSPGTLFGGDRIRRRALTVLTVFGVALQVGMVGYLVHVRSAMMAVYGFDAVLASLALAPYIVGMLLMFLPPIQQRLTRMRLRVVMAGGLAAVSVFCVATGLTFGASSYLVVAALMAGFAIAATAASTAWTGVFLHSVPGELIGVRTGINGAISRIGSAIALALTSYLLASSGQEDYTRRLLAAGVPLDRLEEAIAALNIVLDPATSSEVVDPDIALRLVAGYQLSYIQAFQWVMLVAAGICLVGSAVIWLAMRPQDEQAPSEETA